MAENREALLQQYREMRADLLSAIDGVSDELLSARTLDGWSVKDHLAHLAVWDDVRSSEVVRISAGYESAWRMNDEQDDLYNAITHDLRRELSIAQVRWEFDASHQRLLNAIGAATGRGLDGSLYGEAGLNSSHEADHTKWIRRWRGEQGL